MIAAHFAVKKFAVGHSNGQGLQAQYVSDWNNSTERYMKVRSAWMLLVLLLPAYASAGGTAYRAIAQDGRVSFADRGAQHSATPIEQTKVTAQALYGKWQAIGSDGRVTELKLSERGSFIFDQTDPNSPHRVYMCGAWTHGERHLALDVVAHKAQLSSGKIIDTSHPAPQELKVLAAHSTTMVLRLPDGDVLNFARLIRHP